MSKDERDKVEQQMQEIEETALEIIVLTKRIHKAADATLQIFREATSA